MHKVQNIIYNLIIKINQLIYKLQYIIWTLGFFDLL